MKALVSLAVVTLVSATHASAQDAPVRGTNVPAVGANDALSPQKFADAASAGHRFEIQSSQIALRRSSEQGIRAFAEQLLSDHGKADRDLKEAAREQNVVIRVDFSEDQKNKLKALDDAPNEQFGASFLSLQALTHQESIAIHDRYGKEGPAGSLKAHALSQLSTLRTHLVRAEGSADE
ncbi:DUF4142 domain-containing protein [Rhizobium sp. RM]|uniref:DUF4142 domain-containing protein n=1 Tax=Rhizobium sp. RM TaxID=2748079 RepID=UPI00110EB8CB|nr:DUF4142 domain-containing protein [Rhizobium sp. RM]NWJ27594.1 DUF4142 domain-containing protein [Rhizobium sp. RM]TMV19955.1 DUF4142 domain-containing protein [Rhizobium sp. Td3]